MGRSVVITTLEAKKMNTNLVTEPGSSSLPRHLFILVDEEGKHIYSHAPEIQILDNERHSDNKMDTHRSGSLYDMVASHPSSHKPAYS